MTGVNKGAIRNIQLTLGRALQWAICLLHLNELPLRHLFIELDGTTKSPDEFSGPIGSQLNGAVSDWPVNRFKPIKNSNFPLLPAEVVDDLSTDRHYSYRICAAVMSGKVTTDLQLLEIGPLCHSRWLTLAARILRYYISQKAPSKLLVTLAEFCISVYFPCWFEIKKNPSFTEGSRHYYSMLLKIKRFPRREARAIALANLCQNSYYAHSDNILVAMLGDEDRSVRQQAVDHILSVRNSKAPASVEVRRFIRPVINTKASTYYEMINIADNITEEPPIIKPLTDSQVLDLIEN